MYSTMSAIVVFGLVCGKYRDLIEYMTLAALWIQIKCATAYKPYFIES
jgi:hypothetical protein